MKGMGTVLTVTGAVAIILLIGVWGFKTSASLSSARAHQESSAPGSPHRGEVDLARDKTRASRTRPMGRSDPAKRQTASRATSRQKVFRVMIDPGHGGKDPGAIGAHGVEEKHITLAIGLDLAHLINKRRGMQAVLTRHTDRYVKLRKRVQMARHAHVDLFISIHVNAGKPSWHGAQVFIRSGHGTVGSASDALADRITARLKRVETTRPDRKADFVVLRSSNIPSVLVETGYLTNPAQAQRLTQHRFQRRVAAAIFRGIKAYRRVHAAAN